MRLVTLAAAAAAGAILSVPALAQPAPAATITFSGGSAAFIAGVNWGGGTLHYKGRNYPIKVNGLSVGGIGANSFRASGNVYGLKRLSDIEGVYGAIEASATAVEGKGDLRMSNDKGVEIRAHSATAGLKIALAPSGSYIRDKAI